MKLASNIIKRMSSLLSPAPCSRPQPAADINLRNINRRNANRYSSHYDKLLMMMS